MKLRTVEASLDRIDLHLRKLLWCVARWERAIVKPVDYRNSGRQKNGILPLKRVSVRKCDSARKGAS